MKVVFVKKQLFELAELSARSLLLTTTAFVRSPGICEWGWVRMLFAHPQSCRMQRLHGSPVEHLLRPFCESAYSKRSMRIFARLLSWFAHDVVEAESAFFEKDTHVQIFETVLFVAKLVLFTHMPTIRAFPCRVFFFFFFAFLIVQMKVLVLSFFLVWSFWSSVVHATLVQKQKFPSFFFLLFVYCKARWGRSQQ